MARFFTSIHLLNILAWMFPFIIYVQACCEEPTLLWTQRSHAWSKIRGIEGHPDTWVPYNIQNRRYVQSGTEKNTIRYCLAYDAHSDQIFWSESASGVIKRQDANNTFLYPVQFDGVETIYDKKNADVKAISVDEFTGNVYYTDAGNQHVGVARRRDDGQNIYKILFSGLSGTPSGITVDPLANYLFWAEMGDAPKIQRSDLSGRNRKVLIEGDIREPLGLTVDKESAILIWVDRLKGMIESCDYNGENRQELVSSTVENSFFSVAHFQEYLFVSTETALKVLVYSRTNGSLLRIHDVDAVPYHLIVAQQQPRPPHVCDTLECSDLCLSSSGSKGHCACRQGYYLTSDSKSCSEESNPEFLHSVGHSILHTSARLSRDQPQILNLTYRSIVTGMDRIQGLAYSSVSSTLHFSDTFRDIIYRTTISPGSDVRELTVQTGHVEGLAVDWVNNKLYWSDSELGHIMISQIEGHYHSMLIDGLEDPGPLVIDLRNKYIYWYGKQRREYVIFKSWLNGKNSGNLLSTGERLLKGLALDTQANTLYWTDRDAERIELLDLATNTHSTITDAPTSSLYDVTVHPGYITWTESSTELQFAMRHSGDALENVNVASTSASLTSNTSYDIVLYGDYLQPSLPGGGCGVDNGGCQHHCFPTPDGRSCGCAIGYRLAPDQKSCLSSTLGRFFLLYMDPYHKQLYQHSIEVNGTHRPQGIPVPTMEFPVSAVYDVFHDKVFWIDRDLLQIWSAKLDGSNAELVHQCQDGDRPVRLAVGNNGLHLFYVDSSRNSVSRILVESKQREVILSDLDHVTDVAVELHTNRLITASGSNILFCNAEGTIDEVKETALTGPLHLSTHENENKLYVADQNTGTVLVLWTNDTNADSNILFSDSTLEINSIAAGGKNIYFTAWNAKGVFQIDHDGGNLEMTTEHIYARIYDLKVYEMQAPMPQIATSTATNLTFLWAILGVLLLLALLATVVCVVHRKRMNNEAPPLPESVESHENPAMTSDIVTTNEEVLRGTKTPAEKQTGPPEDGESSANSHNYSEAASPQNAQVEKTYENFPPSKGEHADQSDVPKRLENDAIKSDDQVSTDCENGLKADDDAGHVSDNSELSLIAKPLTNVRRVPTLDCKSPKFKKRNPQSEKADEPEADVSGNPEIHDNPNVANIIQKFTKRLKKGISSLGANSPDNPTAMHEKAGNSPLEVKVADASKFEAAQDKPLFPSVQKVHIMPRGYAPASHNRPREVRTTWGKAKSQAELQLNADKGKNFGQQI